MSGHIEEYNSSEELARAHQADVFKKEQEAKEKKVATQKERFHTTLDKYIILHSNTKNVRDEAKKNNRTNDYQLDLSADIVDILVKIKSEMR